MKVELDENGKLTIYPESGMEAFALKEWSKDYFSHIENDGNGLAIFQVNGTYTPCQYMVSAGFAQTISPLSELGDDDEEDYRD